MSLELVQDYANYWAYIVLMMIGMFAMISKNNLIKKLIGMVIFQSAIILFYVSTGVKEGANIPILSHDEVHPAHHGDDHAGDSHDAPHDKPHHADAAALDPARFSNPIPHVLMLTAIVVGVSTLGVALAIVQRVYTDYGSIEEDEILEQIRPGAHD